MRILVVEDTPKHIDDAKKFFAAHPDVDVVFASTYQDISKYLDLGGYGRGDLPKVDGVISDIYFPLAKPDRYSGETWSQPEAIGVAVMVLCRERKIPCMLNTAGYHHGSKYQWVCTLQRTLHLPELVDASGDYFAEADAKSWDKAFIGLQKLIELGLCSKHNHYDHCPREASNI